ncbi:MULTISPECIES: sensor histidine kinase [Prauserella salsuginis group]|uniref:histidine kinase n=1 Tax=Prauserella salsuginis TaxID=387889 RepID=A0ABW6GB20_9PSEU|nr:MULTISPECIES: HAMP domain-containing sensor histidine kinase [Prauserella salsuginis group]MCR3722372.1 Signal transduction histidine kinase [Prauserella flava]MCR3736814.1 Signal transduction histidine kinase [Prauserella salsuginis]
MKDPRRWWRRRSLRLRITAVATVVAAAVLLVLALLAGRLVGPWLLGGVDTDLRAAVSTAARAVESGTAPSTSDGLRVRVLDTAGDPVDGGGPPALGDAHVGDLKAGLAVTVEGPDDAVPTRWAGTVATAPDGAQRLVVAEDPLAGASAVIADGGMLLVGLAVAGAVLVGATTWLVTGAALRPVGRMRRSLPALPSGGRLPEPGSADELGALAAELNDLLARYDEVGERLRRFTGDAAHELRSPVASIRVQAEVGVAASDGDLAQETLADILVETERLSTLLDGLLTLARADAGEVPAAEPVELVTEVRAAVERLGAEEPDMRVSALVPSAWALAAPSEVELVLDNLLRNACRHAASSVVVSVLAMRAWVRVVVDDDGPGIEPEHRGHVFDRFYRASDDRARSSGGTGLGLALVAEAVRRRGGRVVVGESPDGGARFEVSWRRHDRRS